MTRKVVLATVGSLGDLHPFLALSLALRDRGLDVVLACAPEYRDKVLAAGVAFHALRPGFEEIQGDLRMDRAKLTRRVIDDSDFLFSRLVLPYVKPAYEDMMEATAGATLVLTSSLALGARLAAETRGIPCIAIILQPMMFLSAHDLPVFPGAPWLTVLLRRVGPGPARCVLRMLKTAVRWRFRRLRGLRAAIGLAPTKLDPLFDGQFTSAGAIGLYSRLLGGVQPDYPRPTSIVGFPSFDSEDGLPVALDPALEAFLGSGAAPLVFTLGSLVINSPGDFYRESVEVSRNVKRRAVLLVGDDAGALRARWGSAQVFVCAYAPHSLLFPRAAAIVHQGGIGTLAQALRSGRPQLIVPFFADQLDNAARAARLGVARVSSPRRYSRATARAHLERLLSGGHGADHAAGGTGGAGDHGAPDDDGAPHDAGESSYCARAREVGLSLAGEDGAAQAARIVLDTLEQLERK